MNWYSGLQFILQHNFFFMLVVCLFFGFLAVNHRRQPISRIYAFLDGMCLPQMIFDLLF